MRLSANLGSEACQPAIHEQARPVAFAQPQGNRGAHTELGYMGHQAPHFPARWQPHPVLVEGPLKFSLDYHALPVFVRATFQAVGTEHDL